MLLQLVMPAVGLSVGTRRERWCACALLQQVGAGRLDGWAGCLQLLCGRQQGLPMLLHVLCL